MEMPSGLRRARPNLILDFSGAVNLVDVTEPKGVIGMKRLIGPTNLAGPRFAIAPHADVILGLITLMTSPTAMRGTSMSTAALPRHTKWMEPMGVTVVNMMKESAIIGVV